MDLIITILPVVTKDLPISPRFTPYDFYRDACLAILQLVNQWLNFTSSRSHAFRYGRKNIEPTLVRIDLTTSALSRCAGYLLDHSGDELSVVKSNHLFSKRNFVSNSINYCTEVAACLGGWKKTRAISS